MPSTANTTYGPLYGYCRFQAPSKEIHYAMSLRARSLPLIGAGMLAGCVLLSVTTALPSAALADENLDRSAASALLCVFQDPTNTNIRLAAWGPSVDAQAAGSCQAAIGTGSRPFRTAGRVAAH
jgi:hypothetical protein